MQTQTDFSRQDTETASSQRSSVERLDTEQQFSLRNTGAYIFDPRIVTLSVGGNFGLSQGRFTADGTSASREGTLWGFDAFAGILSGQPVSLNLFANRNESFVSRELAGRSEVVTENRGATLFSTRLKIPSRLSFRQ
ncbi:MAG: hypothetical protein ACE5IM_12570 [Nitrospinota bacterium]